MAPITPTTIATWSALGLAGITAISLLWDKLFGVISKMHSDIGSLKDKSEATAQLTLNVASNQAMNPDPTSGNPDPTLIAAVKNTLESHPPVAPQPMKVIT